MRHELKYFRIENFYGGWQEWFSDFMMKIGGCGAVTACDCCIYFDLYKGTGKLYPYNLAELTKSDYIEFSRIMKPYLRPRWSGIDKLEIYMDGFGMYLADHGCDHISMEPFYGDEDVSAAREVIIRQIDDGFPIPCLTLKHADPFYDDYEWHWFLLTGYEMYGNDFIVKAVTYGSWRWLSLEGLWNTRHERKGGLVLFRDKRFLNG